MKPSTRQKPIPLRATPRRGFAYVDLGVRWPMIVLAVFLLTGCQAIAESLAEESDPRHVGARAPTLIHNDVYGNPISPSNR